MDIFRKWYILETKSFGATGTAVGEIVLILH